MFFDDVTEKIELVAELDLWIGHGPLSSLPPRRMRVGFQSTLSKRSTIETVALRASKSIGRRRSWPLCDLVAVALVWKSACCSCADCFIHNHAERKIPVCQASDSPYTIGFWPAGLEKRNQSSVRDTDACLRLRWRKGHETAADRQIPIYRARLRCEVVHPAGRSVKMGLNNELAFPESPRACN